MIGRTFLGRYEVTRLLGEGGMGKVYLARQIDLNRQVVVKVMNESVAADPKFQDRFERETLLMAKFQHPYVVTLIDASLKDPLGPCIVMEYVRGINLENLLEKNRRFAPARVGRLLGQLCEALQAAHDQGIIHRDLKPSNIMVVDSDSPRERIKVMDFGLAKVVDKSDPDFKKVTDTNVEFAVGTPGYISPEQVRGDGIDHRSDLYSLGVLAYELLTGRLPFNGATGMDMVLAHATEPPPTFAEIGLEGMVSPHIEGVVQLTLAKDPAGRPQSAAEFAERFEVGLLRAAEDTAAPADPDLLTEQYATGPPRNPEDVEPPADDPSALEFMLEAWMPHKIALLKLRGYVTANNGTIVESVPGLIRVKLAVALPEGQVGTFRWLGLGKKALPITLDLRMVATPGRENKLIIKARYRPTEAPLSDYHLWRRICVEQFIDLRSYLIGASENE